MKTQIDENATIERFLALIEEDLSEDDFLTRFQEDFSEDEQSFIGDRYIDFLNTSPDNEGSTDVETSQPD